MKKIFYPTFMLILMASCAFAILEIVNWKIKEDSYSVKFSGNKVEGIFKGLKADIIFDDQNLSASTISASIEASTVNTGNGLKNKHLLDAIDASQYPLIKFESKSISKKGSTYEAIGNLTLKGVTKEMVLPFSYERKGEEAIFSGRFKVVMKDYSISRGGIPDEVEVVLTVPVVK